MSGTGQVFKNYLLNQGMNLSGFLLAGPFAARNSLPQDRTVSLGRYISWEFVPSVWGPIERVYQMDPRSILVFTFACFLFFCIPCRWTLSLFIAGKVK